MKSLRGLISNFGASKSEVGLSFPLMHRRGLQHISCSVSGKDVLTRCIHRGAAASLNSAKPTPQPPPKGKGKATLPPPLKDGTVTRSVDGGRRSAPKRRYVPKDVQRSTEELIESLAQYACKGPPLEQSVQSTVPSQTKTQFFAEPAPEVAADFSAQEDFGESRSIQAGTFIELRRYVSRTYLVCAGSPLNTET